LRRGTLVLPPLRLVTDETLLLKTFGVPMFGYILFVVDPFGTVR
jgi:hypothetical protein